jgi:endoglycosylceramidase
VRPFTVAKVAKVAAVAAVAKSTRVAIGVVLVVSLVGGLLSACGGSSGSGAGHSSTTGHGSAAGSSASQLPAANPSTGPVGLISAPGGPFMYDADGRVVLMHGVNLVYKVAPYEIEVSGSGPNVLTTAEVQKMASLGFDVVRLGIIWKGLEPGTDPINDPAICTHGDPTSATAASAAGQFQQSVFDPYLSRLDETITMLAKYGIYSLLDMHQDVYSDVFAGEGAPNWAVCTNGLKPKPVYNIPNWSNNLQGPGVVQAYENFWENDVVGDLQVQFDMLWTRIASHFKGNPWVVGYDPFNEPYGAGLPPVGSGATFDAQLQCFYMGRSDPGTDQSGKPISCPPDDPAVGLIPRVEAADPTHLVFYEPNYTVDSGPPNHIGPMSEPRLVLNFHDYCFLHVPNGPEPADFGTVCAPLESLVFNERSKERAKDSVPQQPGGPSWMLTEFGASTDTADLARITADADAHLVGWMYWQWLHYDDPTGSHTSGLWPPTAPTPGMLKVLSQTYPEAIAGTPTATSFDQATAAFTLDYKPDDSITAPTVIFVPVSMHYPDGYCAKVTGANVVSKPDSDHLDIQNEPGATTVTVSVTQGTC